MDGYDALALGGIIAGVALGLLAVVALGIAVIQLVRFGVRWFGSGQWRRDLWK